MSPNVTWRELGDWYNLLCHGVMYLNEGNRANAKIAMIDVIDKIESKRDEYGIFASFKSLAEEQEGEGPEFPDGHDHEGFAGGCERFGHTKDSCPEKTYSAADRIRDIKRLLDFKSEHGDNALFFTLLDVILKD